MNIPVRRGKEVKAGRGNVLRCKGWRQEAILRLLENNLENGEDPDNLVIYMSIARAARDYGNSTGIPGIDQMLRSGGFYRGSSILLSGVAGTGRQPSRRISSTRPAAVASAVCSLCLRKARPKSAGTICRLDST